MSLGGPSGALAPVPQAQAESHYLITIVNDVPFCSTCASVMGRDRQTVTLLCPKSSTPFGPAVSLLPPRAEYEFI